MARAGNRMWEFLKGVWNVTSSDARLDNPEFITGMKQPVEISEVLSNAGTFDLGTGDPTSPPVGAMAGRGISYAQGYEKGYFCEEYGYIIGICSVTPMPQYMEGIPRHMLRTDPLDWANPFFAHLGEQEIQNNEIYAYTATGTDTFGYIPRYAEYKFAPGRISGDMRTTMDFWHTARIFGALPALSEEFLAIDPEDFERIFAVQDGTDELIINLYVHDVANRRLPVFGTPNL